MKRRSRARELALQILYQMEICRQDSLIAMDNFWEAHLEENIDEEVKKFASELVKGVEQNLDVLNQKISQYATNWKLERMAYVDRNILRMASFELIFKDDIPFKVSINEAVELAKKFSGQEAGKFVNGILDKVRLEVNK